MTAPGASVPDGGPHYRAAIDAEKCPASGCCIAACEPGAIHEGPNRWPAVIGCACAGAMPELLPGKSVVDPDQCNGCEECLSVCPGHAIEMVPVAMPEGAPTREGKARRTT